MGILYNPLVSVIVITYNSEKYVLETLESIYNQTYENIELIISDDASKDNTLDICKNWITEFGNRFKCTSIVTTKKNKGIPANCNRGIKVSNGEWIKLIAGDDKLIENCIENNIIYTNKNKDAKIIFSNVIEFNSCINRKGIFDNYLIKNSCQKQFEILLLKNSIYAPTSFINKTIFLKYGTFFEYYKRIEDYPYWLYLLKKGERIYGFDKETIYYRLKEIDELKKKNKFCRLNTELRLIKIYRFISLIRLLKFKTAIDLILK